MNHLAHLFLSQSDVNLLVGNYIADHVKGKEIEKFSAEVQRGIQMHRSIDDFTDHHPIVQKSKERLYPKYHKYAAVIVDMFYDYILAKNWSDYSPIKLNLFSSSAYVMLKTQYDTFPDSAKRMYDHMSANDWLTNYGTIEGITWALSGLAYRAKFDSKMEDSVKDLEKDLDLYQEEFETFFPQLIVHANEWTKAYE